MAKSLRQLSTKCGKCGVVFDEQHPKQKRRALCTECYTIELEERNKKLIAQRKEVGATLNRIQAYKNYKVENRSAFWKTINKELRPLTKREDIRAFLSKQMDRILEDKELMLYINLVSVADQRKNEKL